MLHRSRRAYRSGPLLAIAATIGALLSPLAVSPAVAAPVVAGPGIAAAAPAPTERQELNFNTDWRYKQGEVSGAESVEFGDGAWSWVNLPHSTKFVTPEDVTEYLGVSWYRKHFTIAPALVGKTIAINFEGAMQKAEVWVNGEKLATHVGGYTPFYIDVTKTLVSGENVIAVKVDSRPSADFAPGKTGVDMRYFGGIYRGVKMIVTDAVHVTNAVAENEVAGGGVFVTTPTVSASSATVKVRTDVDNDSTTSRLVTVGVDLVNQEDVVVATATKTATVAGGGGETLESTLTVSDPALWHPDHPDLYRAEISVLADGVEVDQVSERFGIRRIEWSHDGLFINGERFKAIGANKHQEMYGLGNALPEDEIYLDVKRAKDAGFDFIRASHYPNDPAFYAACDELGVLVLNSMTGWQTFYDSTTFKENTYQELRDMVRRDRNHPSVVAWETSLNESEYTSTWARTVHDIAHAEYPGDQMFTAGWKDYFDIYLGASQHGVRSTSIQKPIIISEWGDWDYGGNSSSSRVARESYDFSGYPGGNNLQQTRNHQEGLNANLGLSWFSADGLWDFADMSGYNSTASLMGVTDFYRIPKFGTYFFQSQRDPDLELGNGIQSGPMVFIANTWSANSPTSVTVYSNAEQVRLSKNGVVVATQRPDTGWNTASLPHPPFTFDVGAYAPGELKAEAIIAGEVVETTVRKTAGAARSIDLAPDADLALDADGSDARLVYINVVDSNGTTAYTNKADVNVSVSGPGSVVGPTTLTMKGGQLAVWVRAKRTAGEITLTATSPGLETGTVTLTSKAVAGLPEPQYDDSQMGLENIAAGRPATASSTASSSSAAASTDDDTSTSWSAADGSASWLRVDLGARYDLAGSSLHWPRSSASKYRLQVSDDGIVWDQVLDRTGDRDDAATDYNAWAGTGRYVRAVFPAGSAASVSEFLLYGAPASAPTPVDVAQEKTRVLASNWKAGHEPAIGNNGDPSEYWQAARGGNVWWSVDLGARYEIGSTVVTWLDDDRAYQYTIDVSNDGVNYTQVVDRTTNTTAQSESQDDVSAQARYVRISITGGSTDESPVGFYNFKAIAVPSSDLAARKESTASSSESGSDAARANDIATGTAWVASTTGAATWSVDLGASFSIAGVDVELGADSPKGYVIERSADGSTWTTAADRSAATDRIQHISTGLTARYLRVVFPEGADQRASLVDVSVYAPSPGKSPNYALGSAYPAVRTSATYSNNGGGDSLSTINDGTISYATSGSSKNVWTNWVNSARPEDTVTLNLGTERLVDRAVLYVYTDGGAVAPESVKVQVLQNGAWTDVRNRVASPSAPAAGTNTFAFTGVRTSEIRFVMTAGKFPGGGTATLALTEVEVYGSDPSLPVRAESVSIATVAGEPVITERGGTLGLTATQGPAGSALPAVTWAIETIEPAGGEEVASISADGVVTGLGEGAARVTALSGDGWNTLGSLDVRVDFEDLRAPVITSLTPGSGPIAGGTVVTVNGTGFTAGTTVSVDGSAPITPLSIEASDAEATSLTFAAPAHAAGAVGVTVTTPGGTSAAASFRYENTLAAAKVTTEVRCVAAKALLAVTAFNEATVPVTITVTSAYGTKVFKDVAPGAKVFHTFTTRLKTVPAQDVAVTATGALDGVNQEVTTNSAVAAFGC